MPEVKISLIICVVLALCVAVAFLYVHHFDRPMLYYHWASPELPQGRAVPFFNPLRDRRDERTAEQVIHDLRTNGCEEISSQRLQANSAEICPVMRGTTKATLVWEDGRPDGVRGAPDRVLIYDLPERGARLFVHFGRDEAGWEVTTVSILR